jgi:hypothetical protein
METTDTIIRPASETSHGVPQTQQREEQAKAKMDEYIKAHREKAARTMESIRDIVPTDRVIPAAAFTFKADEGQLQYIAPSGKKDGGKLVETFHRNALQQIADRLDVPMAYVDRVAAKGQWGLDLLAKDFQEHADHSADRYLVRSVAGQARGILSDSFRRIDCRPGFLSLMEEAQSRGLIVSDGVFTDTRSSVKFIYPQPLEVFPGEWMVFGNEWSNSDYGRGASNLREFFWRAWCWNGATGESILRQVHSGKRLSDDIEYQQDTVDADAKASALMLRDAARDGMSERRIKRMIEGIRSANETKIDGKARAEGLKKVLTKTEAEAVVQAFNGADVENMPAGNTLWRWSNAISWVGGHTEDADRRLDFERLAGEVMKPAMPKVAEKVAA